MKIRELGNGHYLFRCPGCGCAHVVSTAWQVDTVTDTITPSVLVQGGTDQVVCHSFVTDGRIAFLADSSHALAGQTVDLPDWPLSAP